MKNALIVFAVLTLLGFLVAFVDKPSDPAPSSALSYEYVLVTYTINGKDIQIYSGGTSHESKKVEKEAGVNNTAVMVFNELGTQGYALESVVSNGVPGQMTPLIMCYFKKAKE